MELRIEGDHCLKAFLGNTQKEQTCGVFILTKFVNSSSPKFMFKCHLCSILNLEFHVCLIQEIRQGEVDVIRSLFERAISLSLPPKKMKVPNNMISKSAL